MQFLIEHNSNLIPKLESCSGLGMRLICTSYTPPSSCCHSSSCVQNVEAVARYIQQQNRDIYERCGVTIGDPMDRGLRCVSSWHLAGLNFPRHTFVSTLESQLGGGSKEIGSWQLVVMAIDSYQWAILHVVELEFAEQILPVPGGQVLSFPDVQEHSMCGCSGHMRLASS